MTSGSQTRVRNFWGSPGSSLSNHAFVQGLVYVHQTIHTNRLNAEASVRSQLPPVKQDARDLQRMSHKPLNRCYGKTVARKNKSLTVTSNKLIFQ